MAGAVEGMSEDFDSEAGYRDLIANIAAGEVRLSDPPSGAVLDARDLDRLATLSPIDYEREREMAARVLGIRVGVLDAEVKRRRGANDPVEPKQGRALAFPKPELWPASVDGAVLLNELAGTFTRYPNIEHITVCEIEPVIPPTSTKYFGKYNYEVYKNPKTRVVFDDARHYLMTTNDKYDIIASDPLDVFAKGTAAIYSKEYFESVKPEPALWPAEPKARARARLLEHKSDEVYFPPIVRLMGLQAAPDDPAAVEARSVALAYCDEMEKLISDREWLAGGYSYADVAFYMAQLFGERMGAPMTDAHPHLRQWRDRMSGRPAVRPVAGAMARYLLSQGPKLPAFLAKLNA